MSINGGPDETKAEKTDRQEVAELKVEVARESLATEAKPRSESTDLWVQGSVFLTSVIMYVSAEVLHFKLAETLAAAGAGFLLSMGASAWHWYKRTHAPVQVPIAGTKAAEPIAE